MKLEVRSTKPETNLKFPSTKRFDLEERSLKFAKDVRLFVKKLPRDIVTSEDARQLVRASGSVGANYLEANESLSKKDFLLRAKIAKKEARECIWWLELLSLPDELQSDRRMLMKEAAELMNILGAIVRNSS